MKKLITSAIFLVITLNLFGTSVAFAQEAGTLLPETTLSDTQCDEEMRKLEETNKWEITKLDGTKETVKEPRLYFASLERAKKNDILACAVITGKIKFWMIPFYIVYLIEFAIGISGLVAIGFLIYGGFQYVIGGATEKQENAKNTIKWALIGLVIILVAWVVVNLVQFLVTI